MSSQTTNNYLTTLTFPNSYITRKFNNMDKAQAIKTEQDDWVRLYYKTLKGLEAIINIQEHVQNIMKIARETNTTIIKIKETMLKASVNNQTMNTTNILEISEDLQYLIQSNMENQIFQIQRMLANKLDAYRGKGNSYMDDNIQEIQELYKDEEQKKDKETIKDEEIILIKPYEVSE